MSESLNGKAGFELHVVAEELGGDKWNLGISAHWNDINSVTEADLVTRGYAALGWLLDKATDPTKPTTPDVPSE